MSDVAIAEAPAEAPAGNSTEARAPDGTLKDVQASPAPATPEPTKPAEAAKEGDKPAAEKGVVPEKYELKPAEGTTLDEKLIAEVTPVFKELGLDNAQAQKLFDFHSKAVQSALEGPAALLQEMRTSWRNDVVKDAALGNGIDNLKPEVRVNIAKAIEAVGDAKAVASFKEAMDLTGAGDNPALIRGLNNLGKLLSEGTLVRGAAPASTGQTAPGATARPSPAQAMYPGLPSSAQS